MSYIYTYPMQHSTVINVFSEQDSIIFDPEYQRNGEVWNIDKRQLLIDSIINNYDIPKLYFHKLGKEFEKKDKEFAIIDGRQRIETIRDYMNGVFPLSDEFNYLKDDKIKLAGLTYTDIAKKYPKIKIKLDSYVLPIICVETDDLELIEDMFSRLNEAVPLNAAEKRNAMGGDVALAIRQIADVSFFKNKINFSNKRYQHREVAARLIWLLHSKKENNRILDTKKIYLDTFTKVYKTGNKKYITELKNNVIEVLNTMNDIFINKDPLLKAQGLITVYFLLFKEAIDKKKIETLSRENLMLFKTAVDENRKAAQDDITKADFDLLEFDRMSQQGTNDASSIKERLSVIKNFIGL